MSVPPSLARLGLAVVAIGCFATSFSIVTARLARSPEGSYVAAARSKSGVELIAVFIGSSTCGASQNGSLPPAIAAIRESLRAEAERTNKRFVYIGIAVDSDPVVGLDFLKGFGPFDEVMAGGNWLNTGAISFVTRDLPGPQAIPQLVLVERSIEGDDNAVASVDDRLLGRKVGGSSIIQFAEALHARDRLGPPSTEDPR